MASALQSQAVTSGRTFLRGRLWRLYGGAICQSSGDSDMGIYHPGAAKGWMDCAAKHRPSVLSFARHVVTSPPADNLDCIWTSGCPHVFGDANQFLLSRLSRK